jgi:hypothetical protein
VEQVVKLLEANEEELKAMQAKMDSNQVQTEAN